MAYAKSSCYRRRQLTFHHGVFTWVVRCPDSSCFHDSFRHLQTHFVFIWRGLNEKSCVCQVDWGQDFAHVTSRSEDVSILCYFLKHEILYTQNWEQCCLQGLSSLQEKETPGQLGMCLGAHVGTVCRTR